MAQVNYKVRLSTYRKNFLDSKTWEESMLPKIKAGERVTGVLKMVAPLATVLAYARLAYVAAGNELKDENGKEKELDAGTITSIRGGLMDDVGQLYAQTSIVKIDGKEMTGEEWFEPKVKAKNSKLKFRDFAKALDDLAKSDKKSVVHRGVQWQLADCIVKYSSGKKGKQKKSILKTIDEI